MSWLKEITKIAEWGELAAIAALSVLLFNVTKYIVIQTYQKFRLNKALTQRHILSILIKNEEDDNVILKCHTYFKRKLGYSIAFGTWILHRDIHITGNAGVFEINKNDIYRNCNSANSPYNFTLEIPNNESAKEKYFSRLAFQGFIITGRGKALESDGKRWLIYFLHPDEPFHIDSGYSWELKNSLFK